MRERLRYVQELVKAAELEKAELAERMLNAAELSRWLRKQNGVLEKRMRRGISSVCKLIAATGEEALAYDRVCEVLTKYVDDYGPGGADE